MGCAGSLSLLFVYSLDYARTRLANDAKGKGGERQYKGLIDVYAKTLKSDGIQGLYRGFVISCVGIFVYRGMYFGLYDSLKPILLGPDAGLFLSFCLGYGVTVTSGLMSYPIDTIRRRMMMTSGTAVKYKGSVDCRSNHEERGLHVHDEGCRSQHPSWSRWRRCLGRFRYLQEALHRLAYWLSLDRVGKRVLSTNPLWYLTFYSVLSDDSRSGEPGATSSNNHRKTRLSRLLYGHFQYYSNYFKLVKFPIFKL